MKRLRNTSGLPNELVKSVVDWIAEELGLTNFDVECRKCHGDPLAGTAYVYGSGFHTSPRPFVVLRVGEIFPATTQLYQYGQHKGRRVVIANREEALVFIAAHELRHLWQYARTTDKRRSASLSMAHGSRGTFSEVDTEAYAIHKLREWRRAAAKTKAASTPKPVEQHPYRPEKEHKSTQLKRIGERRIRKAVKAISLLGNLANYDPTLEQARKIVGALKAAVKKVADRLSGSAQSDDAVIEL